MIEATVIISTYNKPEWLEKVLIGYSIQDTNRFELIIADDGSGNETAELIARYKTSFPVSLTHVWHEDNGFEKTKILNKSIKKSSARYLIFSDGDCIPRKDFVSQHLKFRQEDRFLSGGYCKLPMKTSKLISEKEIISQECFDSHQLSKIERVHWKNWLKLNASRKKYSEIANWITPSNASFNGCNSSAWKKDILSVNGFDERMKYGGLDREIGERLENIGIKGKSVRYSAICLHLDHKRSYENKESWELNYSIRNQVKKQKLGKTSFGISNYN